ncbi:L-2-hydroxyglutarate oxidase [Phaeocystidibacter marisrubri]|uniref:L-2-hydroxyglutarate oxidase n=1 Tax=Phaeocystidibacter marisrubri TaxID=1577780 RepID=A0A6L3ZHX5_9FLAO|nr:L-2-hydroxyglutarate oxidase [Phaeocystidibacter marisrubri]KAB2817616.1 L-2-hydroxyglutarate oxidase [Phaeocystidibacter marisrubri]GGH74469.1 hydroxyglutarate oxidase [Phaeocystidibacter marisrubri]
MNLIVIGGGIVGLATAYKWQLKNPEGVVTVLEKEAGVAKHQTGRNSGVIHSGIYYKPGSLKATTCRDGYQQLVEFVEKYNVDYDLCGKLIVATEERELPQIDRIYARGIENGLEGLEIIGPDEMTDAEPFVAGIKAIKVPQTGIVDYVGMCLKLAELIVELQPESRVLPHQRVIRITQKGKVTAVKTDTDTFIADRVVACGGLEADRLAALDGLNLDVKIVPFRGDYYDLTPSGEHKVKHLIYPVPDPDLPFLGVHFTRMIKGGVECGPNAVFSFKREGYSKTSFSLRDSLNALRFSGTWNLFKKHWRYGLGEYERAFSRSKFLEALQKLIPSLEDSDITPARAGVRAQALRPDGTLVDDFVIEKGRAAIHVINAPSPAATASLAIADRIVKAL